MFETKVEKLGVLLKPTKRPFEAKGVLNPGIYQDGNTIHVFYRAIDSRYHSSIGYARLQGPTRVVERLQSPLMIGENKYESKGVEDPRIVKIGNTFYLTYVAHDGKNAIVAYADSKDLRQFSRHGVISPAITYDQAAKVFRDEKLKDRYFMFEAYYEEYAGKGVLLWEKDAFLFPKKIKGKFAMIHRILPDIHIVYFDSFKQLQTRTFWKQYLNSLSKFVVLENKYWFESRNIGGGAPPIETKYGWLFIYHAVEELNKSRVYHAGAALLDRRNPTKVLGRLDHPLFSPELKWEKRGAVNNVVFPTGTALFGNKLYIYYGAADNSIAVARVNLSSLLWELRHPSKFKKL